MDEHHDIIEKLEAEEDIKKESEWFPLIGKKLILFFESMLNAGFDKIYAFELTKIYAESIFYNNIEE